MFLPTSKEANNLRLKRMRLILEKLKEGPISLPEAIEVSKAGKRSVQYYLAELKAFGLIIFDEQRRVYESARALRTKPSVEPKIVSKSQKAN